jgi:hypothetical protein
MRLFGFGHLRIRPRPREFNYGVPGDLAAASLYATKPKLFAVFQDPRTQAVAVVCYEDSPEGRSALTAQCRVHRLIKLILGHHVQVETGAKIGFVSGDGAYGDYHRGSVT